MGFSFASWGGVVLVSAVGATACSSGGVDGSAPAAFVRSSLARDVSDVPADDANRAASANNRFAFELDAQLGGEPGNRVFSPFCIRTAFAMAWAGAKGDTASELANAFHFDTPETTHPALNTLDRALRSDTEGAVVTFANALWVSPDRQPLSVYLDTLATSYGAGVGVVDFAENEKAVGTINQWVSEETRGTIGTLLNPTDVDDLTHAVLTTAAYFKAKWLFPFEATTTWEGPFTSSDGTERPVQLMHATQSFGYAEDATLQAAALPYQGRNGSSFEMVVVLPKGPLEALESSFTDGRLADLAASMQPASVRLSLPRFSFASTFDVASELKALGVLVPFGSDADFSGLAAPSPGYITKVAHRGFISVGEDGTEASAATAVVIGRKSANVEPPDTKVLTLDHPFLFFIRHVQTGALLFVGRIEDPSL